jgi:DNA-binding NarL/FixJ family response regulator
MKRAKWTLLDQFERDGKQYLVAVRDDAACGGLALLSSRERQVVAFAARGLSNKVVGFELGISTSTVGVLLSRASAKLGVRSRRELLGKLQGRLPSRVEEHAPGDAQRVGRGAASRSRAVAGVF